MNLIESVIVHSIDVFVLFFILRCKINIFFRNKRNFRYAFEDAFETMKAKMHVFSVLNVSFDIS